MENWSCLAELASSGVDHFDFGPPLAEHAGSRSLDEIYDGTSHYTAATDRFLAESLLEKIRSMQVWKTMRDRIPR